MPVFMGCVIGETGAGGTSRPSKEGLDIGKAMPGSTAVAWFPAAKPPGSAGEPGIRREWFNCVEGASGGGGGAMPAAGVEDHGEGEPTPESDAVNGGWPGGRFGGRPVVSVDGFMPAITPPDGGGDQADEGGLWGGASGCWNGNAVCNVGATTLGVGDVTICPHWGQGPDTPAMAAGTVSVV